MGNDDHIPENQMQQDTCVENVPTEIWAEIFQHAQKTLLLEVTYKETRFTKCDIPISISGVCNRFRQIAIGTPQLWASVVVDMSDRHPMSPSTLWVTKLWLERSKNSPLSILIHNMNGTELQDHPEKLECFLLLLSHLGRWREARIEWYKTDRHFWESMGILDRAPLLKSLVLGLMVDQDEIEHGLLPSEIWAGSPRLRKLVVLLWVDVEDEDDYNPPQLRISSWATLNDIPYEQITHLHLDAMMYEIISCKEIASIFKRASNLVCCFLEGIADPDHLMRRQFDPIPLNHLRHLYLNVAYDTTYNIRVQNSFQILNLITAPLLLSLTIVGVSELWDSEAFGNFLGRSLCPLEELNVVDVNMTLDELRVCMGRVGSSLRRLYTNKVTPVFKEYMDAFVTNMEEWNPTTNMFSFCPHLEKMYFWPNHIILPPTVPGPSILKFVVRILEARLRPPAGGVTTFKTYVVDSSYQGAQAIPVELSELTNDPFNLELDFDYDTTRTKRSDQVWQQVAYQ